MKKSIRLLTLLLAIVMCVGLLAACGGKDPENTTTPSGTTTAGSGDSEWDALNFGDMTIRVEYNETGNEGNCTGVGAQTNVLMFMRGPDDEGDTSSSDRYAAYTRYNEACEALDLNVEWRECEWTGGDINQIHTIFSSHNLTNIGDEPNIVIHRNYAMVRAAILGDLYNVLDPDETSYINLDHENWYKDMMLENTIDTSKVYMLMGDYFIDQLRYAFATLFNAGMADELFELDGGKNYIYDLVDNGMWTYDQMMTLAESAERGQPGADNFVMGVISNEWIVRNYLATAGLDLFKRDENGEPFYLTGSEIGPIHSWIAKILTMESESYFSYNWIEDTELNPNGDDMSETFINGGALFSLNQTILTLEGSYIQGMDSAAGILPNPKYEPVGSTPNYDTNYRALVSDNANCGGILLGSTSEEFTACTAFLQMMTETSDDFYNAYYNDRLQYKNNPIGTRHVDMLNHIRDGICSPMCMLYDNYCAKAVFGPFGDATYAAIIYKILDSGTNTFQSDWAEQLQAKQGEWEEIKDSFGQKTTN